MISFEVKMLFENQNLFIKKYLSPRFLKKLTEKTLTLDSFKPLPILHILPKIFGLTIYSTTIIIKGRAMS
ncbi:MAG: hypothetical protein A2Y80_01915 [Deltaproteobacteria bacterium RBG_13_58_19]|nr:MAG: hypothetical protein A2Y80_01915 [Deltaproteobacteria bacterium RBG_13_58_19]